MPLSVDIRRGDCRSSISRRRLLQVGGLGALGLSLPQFLWARASSPREERHGRARSCIFVVQYGGASHIDTWDLKPDAPAEIRGPYRPIASSVPGVHMGELLPRLARLAQRYCLVAPCRTATAITTAACTSA